MQREPVKLAAIHAFALTLPPPCWTHEVVCIASWAVPSLLHILLFPSFWYKLIFVSSVHKMLFQKWAGFCRCFPQTTGSMQEQKNAKECYEWGASWGKPSVLTLNNDPPKSSRMSLGSLNIVKEFFPHHAKSSSTFVVFCCLPGLLVLLSLPVHSFFLRTY